MAPNPPKKGERRGGRKKGTPNKATIENALLAERAMLNRAKPLRKLGKEMLDDFMHLFSGMAAFYQPILNGPENPNADPELFEKYARLACDMAKSLTPFQSPTYRAITIQPIVDVPPAPAMKTLPGATVSPQEAYRRMREAVAEDIIEGEIIEAGNGKSRAAR